MSSLDVFIAGLVSGIWMCVITIYIFWDSIKRKLSQ